MRLVVLGAAMVAGHGHLWMGGWGHCGNQALRHEACVWWCGRRKAERAGGPHMPPGRGEHADDELL